MNEPGVYTNNRSRANPREAGGGHIQTARHLEVIVPPLNTFPPTTFF